MHTYQVGDLVRLSANIQVAGVDADPGAVTVKVRSPDGTITTYTDATKDSVGDYHKDVSVTADGVWQYRFSGTSPAQGAGEASFWVEPSDFD